MKSRSEYRGSAPKVLQLLPADGWRVVYADEHGEPFADRLVCWALVTNPDGGSEIDMGEVFAWGERQIVGIVTSIDGDMSVAPESFNFLGYAPADESLDEYREPAQDLRERQRKEQEGKR